MNYFSLGAGVGDIGSLWVTEPKKDLNKLLVANPSDDAWYQQIINEANDRACKRNDRIDAWVASDAYVVVFVVVKLQ